MKKIISIVLILTMLVSCIPAYAQNENDSHQIPDDLPWEIENIGSSDITSPISIGEVYSDENDESITNTNEYEPIVHEESTDNMFEFPEENENLMPVEKPGFGGISLFSVDSEDSSMWKSMYGKMFGDDYLKPYERKEDGEKVTGNTNRLVIEETDLSLPGKNGLDLVLKRKYDNQDYNEAYSYYRDYKSDGSNFYHDVVYDRYIYAFKNTTTKETLYVGFLSKDQMYTYMYNGCHIKKLNERSLKNWNHNGTTIKYYDFENVDFYITEDSSYDWYEYDNSIAMIPATERYEDETNNSIYSRKILNNNGYIGSDWNLLLPEAYLYRYNRETTDKTSYKRYDEEYVGAFRDINGNVYTLEGSGTYKKYKDGVTPSTYTSSFYPDNNKSLYFVNMYQPKTLYDNGPEYNFVIYDGDKLTYYLYDSGATYGNAPKSVHRMYIIAVEDEYGNQIRYEYGDNYGKITKIIDTYGREININKIENGTQISYYDDLSQENKTITYKAETLPASELDNDSPLKPKEVRRFTVTNQEGEKTIYDAREAEVLNYYYSSRSGDMTSAADPQEEDIELSWGYNIERIIYPTGAESRYRYKCIYPINYYAKVRSGVYAVDASYDIVNGKEENKKEYSLKNAGMKITQTCTNNAADTKSILEYNDEGLLSSVNITPQSKTTPYKKIEYTYSSHNNPTKIVTNENGTKNTITYSYSFNNPNMLASESNGLSSVTYDYHSREMNYEGIENPKTVQTDKVKKTTYNKVSGSTSVEDYNIITELTSDKKAIEYVKTIQNNIVKAQVKYEYDGEGNVTAIKQWTDDTNSDGVLDENDDIITLSNTYTVTTQKTRKASNTVSNVLNADGVNEGNVTSEYSYNIYGSPISQKDSYGTVTTVEYDDLNRPVKYNMPNGATRQIEYHTAQNYILVTDEAGIITKIEYDGLGRNKAKYIKDGSTYKKIEEYSYDSVGRLSNKTTYQDEGKGIDEDYQYDNLNRLTARWVDEMGGKMSYVEMYTYNNTSTGTVVSKGIAMSNATSAIEKSYYNQYGQLTKTESISNGTTLTNTYEYDYQGRVIKETDSNGNSTTYEYAYDGQVTKQTNAKGDSVSTVYDLAGQAVSVTDANGNTTNTTYDKLGRSIKVDTPFDDTVSGETKTYYDKNSNIVKTAVKRSANVYQTEEYKYDNMGNLLATIANDGKTDIVTQYQYDTANRITKMITGLSAYSANPTGGALTQYSYNSLGYLAKTIDPMGMEETYNSYDRAGNVLSVTDKNGNTMHNEYGPYGLVKSYFDNLPETKEYTYDDLGQVTAIKSVNADEQSVEETYEYDAFGRLVNSTANDGSVQNYTYDSNSNVTLYQLTKDEDVKNSIDYTYNNLNQLTTLTNNGIITSYTYDANGNLTKKVLNNGVNTNYTYNKAGLMTYMESKKGSNVYTYSDCTYLLNGLLSRVDMPYDANPSEGKIKYYSYDNAGRLISDNITNAAGFPVDNTYEYDLRGNRVKMVSSPADEDETETINYEYDLNNRLLNENSHIYDEYHNTNSYSSTRYYYDNNGNMTAKQTTKKGSIPAAQSSRMALSGRSTDTGLSIYRYDAFNRLTNYNSGSVEASYTYNANNLRASKTVNRERTDFVWNGQDLAAENKADTVNTYTYDITGIHIANQNGTVASYLKDYHGNIVGKTTASGALFNELGIKTDYDAFGNRWVGDTPDPFGYCGEYLDSESGLIYLRNRYYDSNTGRFINEDPVKDGLNWYVYCGNNPVMMIDPSGLFDYNTRLSYNPGEYSADVRTLQNELAWKGYLRSSNIDGFFGDITLKAVNQYKNDMGLGNSGNDYGIVGLQTWESLGLIYRTQQDIDSGVQIVNAGAKQYFDISEAVNRAVIRATGEFQQHSGDFDWFRNMVGDYGKWNIKRNKNVWSQTLGISPKTYASPKIFYGRPVVVDDVGNITYGYLGTAANFSPNTLNAGSSLNHIKNHGFGDWSNEKSDQACIAIGIRWYEGYDIQVRFN